MRPWSIHEKGFNPTQGLKPGANLKIYLFTTRILRVSSALLLAIFVAEGGSRPLAIRRVADKDFPAARG
jgi:hypothetical protein